ncbi:hypothetical protein Back11_20110 [Paenibacillus baekrokdamisoli]|uniref:Uncharacterized protein n=1 Tax=Paenibacillus baekrokdamisoli TaxID=1712516 RepID=A0A3G9IQL1_9BACL|nr:DUF4023 domain-containing protein [Paenibacillus baekrokdamisoli]MBB3069983.1 hypothetical protein [Paenibacillus baekrokdamisoli]BBH20666.1 hypothetical protein Back11_20110 [Paenibacillus baekrokdamisoli]
MTDTHGFVEKLHDTQKKAEQNRKRQGGGDPGGKLPHNRHPGNRSK